MRAGGKSNAQLMSAPEVPGLCSEYQTMGAMQVKFIRMLSRAFNFGQCRFALNSKHSTVLFAAFSYKSAAEVELRAEQYQCMPKVGHLPKKVSPNLRPHARDWGIGLRPKSCRDLPYPPSRITRHRKKIGGTGLRWEGCGDLHPLPSTRCRYRACGAGVRIQCLGGRYEMGPSQNGLSTSRV
jgi:hypothetical protein